MESDLKHASLVSGVAGIIRFRVESEENVATKNNPFIRIRHDVNVEKLSNFMITSWNLQPPDIVVSIISGGQHSHAADLKRLEYRDTFQGDFARLFRTVSAWIFDDGYNHGISKLIGAAVKEEEVRRLRNAAWKGRYKRGQNQIIMPKIVAVSMPFLNNLGGSTREAIDTCIPPANADGMQYATKPLVYDIKDQTIRRSNAMQYDLEPHHTHYLLVDDRSDSSTNSSSEGAAQQVANMRCRVIRAVHMFANLRHYGGLARNRLPDSSSSSDDEDDAVTAIKSSPSPVITSNEDIAATNANYPALISNSLAVDRIPLVALCFQGGPEQLEQILYYLERNIPVIVVRGSGFLADLIASTLAELYADGNFDSDLHEFRQAKVQVQGRLKKWFPRNPLLERSESANKIFDQFCAVIRLGAIQSNGRQLVTVLDLKVAAAAEFSSLEESLLNAIMSAQNLHSNLKIQLLLCVKWNEDLIARKRLLTSRHKLKLDADIFEMALVLKNRHKFIDTFLERNFKVHRYLSHRRLLVLFRRAEHADFFYSVLFEGLLNQSPGSLPDEQFVCVDLPELVRTLTGTSQVVDAYQLTSNSYGIYTSSDGAEEAERKARLALLIWAVLMDRFELAHVIWRHCDDPIPTALFVSHMFQSLRKLCNEPEISSRLQQNSEAFSDLAYNVLNSGYNDAAVLAFEVLEQNYADFQNKTPLLLAYEAHNKKFLIHPCCQKWLRHLYYGRMNVYGKVKLRFAAFSLQKCLSDWLPESLKVLSAAYLIWPMFFWISFPFSYTTERERFFADAENEEMFRSLNDLGTVGGDEADNIEADEFLLAEAYQFGPEIIVPRGRQIRTYPSQAGSTALSTQMYGLSQRRTSKRGSTDLGVRRPSLTSSNTANLSAMVNSTGSVNPVIKLALATAGQKALFEKFYSVDTANEAPQDSLARSVSFSTRLGSPLSVPNNESVSSSLSPPTIVVNNDPAATLSTLKVECDPSGRNSVATSRQISNSSAEQQPQQFLSVPLHAGRPPARQLSSKTAMLLGAAAPYAGRADRKFSNNSSNYTAAMRYAASKNAQQENAGVLSASNGNLPTNFMLSADEELAQIADIQRGHRKRHNSHRLRSGPSYMSFNGSIAESSNNSASISLWEKIHCVWTAPITKHYSYCLWHMLFLITYSMAALVPSCNVTTLFTMDAIVWLWTLAMGVELTVRTLKQSDRGHPIDLSKRLLEITFIFALLAVRMALRIMDTGVLFQHPMLAKAVSLIGLFYFFLRIIFEYMPLSKTFGPWLFKVQNMIRYGFVLWILLILPFLCASGIVIQASIYPDKTLSAETFVQAGERIFMSFFTAPMEEVTTVTPRCRATRFNIWHERNSSQSCMAGENSDSDCPTSGVWSYFFLFQFLFILKIVFNSLIFAVFGVYMYTNNEISNINWRFHRYQRLLDFETRCAIPPPFSLIPHCLWMLKVIGYGLFTNSVKNKLQHFQQHERSSVDSQVRRTSVESTVQQPQYAQNMQRLMSRSNYWKALAAVQWSAWNIRRQKEASTEAVADSKTETSAAVLLLKVSEELKQLNFALKRRKTVERMGNGSQAEKIDFDGKTHASIPADKKCSDERIPVPTLLITNYQD